MQPRERTTEPAPQEPPAVPDVDEADDALEADNALETDNALDADNAADADDAADAADALDAPAAVVAALSGSIADMKALRDRCLDVGIPAEVGCPPGAGKSCGPRTHLLIEEQDLPRLAALLGDDWRTLLARDGLAPVAVTADEESEHPPCPACGTAAPLVEGACSDCGLQLE